MRPPIDEQVVVITGASSGIGRETARRLGASGASVVLAARNEEGLSEIKDELEASGCTATYVVTDVAEPGQVQYLAQQAVERMGRIDAWVNNAGIGIYGHFADTTPEEMRRVIEVNLLGEMYGSKAALEHMSTRGSGVIVNVSSALARRSVPLLAAYCASKHGITGFSESLRMELQRDFPDIHVVEVLPASMNTPLFEHARSKLGVLPRPLAPVYQPSVVADAILRACTSPQREIFAGGTGKGLEFAQRIAPGAVDWYLRRGNQGEKGQHDDSPDDGRDNIFEPMEGPGATTGRWSSESKASSLYTSVFETHRTRAAAVVGAAAAAVGVLALRRR